MGIFSRAVAEQKSYSTLDLFKEIYGEGRVSKAGPTITVDNAFKVSVLFACLRVLSQGCAQVPFKLFREEEVSGLKNITPAKEHSLYDTMSVLPNNWTTSFEFRETLVIHAALGNAYAFINRGFGGRIAELILLNPGRVKKEQKKDWSIVYKVTGESGEVQEFPAEAIWHVRGPSWDGVGGMEMLSVAREALGLAIATEESHSGLHMNGVRPSGTYTVEGTLNVEQYGNLKKWIEKEFAGSKNSGIPMILDRGAKWLSQAMTGVDSQHLETRKHQVDEVCRFMGVSPMMVFQSDKTSTFASAEAFFDAHIKHSMLPWYTRIEQSADAYLLSKKERAQGLYFKFVVSGLLRGSAKDRAEYYTRALGSGGHPGWMTPDEVRALEELNPMGNEAGKLPPGAASINAATDTPEKGQI